MKKLTKLSIQWFYDLLERGECDIMDFKQQLEDKQLFGKSIKNFSSSYDELARDVVAFANKKGGFLFVGIIDNTKEINREFCYDQQKTFQLVKQIQDRTVPSITIIPHNLTVAGVQLLVLEIPFSTQMHCTSKSEYLIRCNDGNRRIEPYEMATIMAEKNLIVYDQNIWKLNLDAHELDSQGNPLPGWQSKTRVDRLMKMLPPDSPYLRQPIQEALESMGLSKEEDGEILPTTTGLLFIGNDKALKELPFATINYNRYFPDGTYRHFEYSGNIIETVNSCFSQLRSEIQQKEFHFGLFREYVEDYSEIVLRELLVNAVAHRDYSRLQGIHIRKYPTHIEIESPGPFPEGITPENFLRKTNPRNPNIMDILREIGYAEKAGSGFDKIFTDLLSKGKPFPTPEETDYSITFRVEAEVISTKLMELAAEYRQLEGRDMEIDGLLVMKAILENKKLTMHQLESLPFVSKYNLHRCVDELKELDFIETTGKTSGLSYMIHHSRVHTAKEKSQYLKTRKKDKVRMKKDILEYVDQFDEITNSAAREHLNLPESSRPEVSRLLREMVEDGSLLVKTAPNNKNRVYTKVLQTKKN